tara:strand:- start:154 stop:399 length:246 start_codon:yes stop_codon:yes gene_type:complete
MKYLLLIVVLFLPACVTVPECSTRTLSLEIPSGIPFIDGAFTIRRDNTHRDCGKTTEQLAEDDADRARLGIRLWPRGDDDG